MPFKTAHKYALALIIAAFVGTCALIFHLTYENAKASAIERLNEEQTIHAKQAARGIEQYFATWTGILSSLAKMPEIVAIDPAGKRQIDFFYDVHRDHVSSFTRMDETGTILYSVPAHEATGRNIADQKHVRDLLDSRKPVVSDVFRSVQGIDAIALHVPVFDGTRFKGSIALTFNFHSIAKRYLEVIRIGKTGYAWVVSRDGTELYCPVPGHDGNKVFENCRTFPSVLSMAEDMLRGRSGTATYTFDMVGKTRETHLKKHAVYHPIQLGNTFWSIVVASSEKEVLSSLTSYRNRLIAVLAVAFLGATAIAVVVARAVLIMKQEAARKTAESELRTSEQRYRSLFEQNPAPLLIYERGTYRVLAVNEAFTLCYGYTREEAENLLLPQLYPDEEKQKIIDLASRLSGHSYVGEWHHRRQDGSVFPVVVTSHDITFQGSSARIAVITDITELKRMEEAVKEEADVNRVLFEQSPDGIVIIDPATARFLNFNRSAARQLGYAHDEFAQLKISDIEAMETPEDTRRRIDDIQRRGRGEFETLQRTKQGEVRNVLVSAQIVSIKGEPVYYCVWRDITEHKKLEEQLRQSQKMESVGRLAGGIAHDFNNMLSVIIGAAELSRSQLAGDSPVQKYLEHISAAARRSGEITRQLLAFSRKEIVSPKPVNLNSLIVESEKVLCRLIGEDVKLGFRPATGLWSVLVDPSQVDQVLMNLSANARDAMPDGGTLLIETSNVVIHSDYSRHHADAPPGEYVKISVSDTGVGMDRETREHIFEPFFTTKGIGKGTGLGLATVYGIVTQNGGFVNVYSEPGQGTVFNVYLPRLNEERTEEEEEEAAPAPRPTGSGTILLVEDEQMLLWTTTRLLEEMGYTVIQAETPQMALEVLESNEPFDLVITDVVMPGMNGRELTERIREVRPGAKVLFMSGYTADLVAQRGIVEEGMFYISKPLDSRLLNDKIAQLLAS